MIAHSQPLLTAIKWLGGAYLIYLGCQGIGAKPKQPVDLVDQSANQTIDKQSLTTSQSESTFTILRRGFFCNVFNPKAPVYFVAIFTLVLSPDIPLWQLSIYGVWMMVLQMAWFSTVVMLLSIPVILKRFQRFEHWIDRVLGTAMIVLGLNLIFRSR